MPDLWLRICRLVPGHKTLSIALITKIGKVFKIQKDRRVSYNKYIRKIFALVDSEYFFFYEYLF